MSGKRTKALRRKFMEIMGRAPKTEEQKGVGSFFETVWDRVRGKNVRQAKQVRFVLSSRNEFRRFRRSGKTATHAEEWAEFLKRRAEHADWIERNNERIRRGVALSIVTREAA